MHTPTKHLSTNAIIQSLHMISLFKAMPAIILQVLYKKKKKLNKLRTKCTGLHSSVGRALQHYSRGHGFESSVDVKQTDNTSELNAISLS